MENETILRYAGNLVELWLNTVDEDYPLNACEKYEWIRPLGVPMTSYWATFNSKEELWGRILLAGQLVGAESIKGRTPQGEIEVKL